MIKGTFKTLFHCTLQAKGSQTVLITQHIAADNKTIAKRLFLGYLGKFYPEVPVYNNRLTIEMDKEGDGSILVHEKD